MTTASDDRGSTEFCKATPGPAANRGDIPVRVDRLGLLPGDHFRRCTEHARAAGDSALGLGAAAFAGEPVGPRRRRRRLPYRRPPRLVAACAAALAGAGDGLRLRGPGELRVRAGAGGQQDVHLLPVLTGWIRA